ncbi:putative ABC transport system permease protein [Methanofollis sp. W23]|uniref:ABC transporter permease n=1 Tax=Methanofollis sp. W23 TaxID=2817849 RepID=UPI001AEA6A3F|nr:ABC transporter permease [Methanofollis sp. W23]MBP2146330.1 putative ABC transport system permease protein [Methanofollis sp. W23]
MIFFSFATRNLRRHTVRSFLATLGIVIGVFAIASLGVMGNSINLLAAGLIADVGDTVVITPHTALGGEGIVGDPRTMVAATISETDVDRIERAAGGNPVVAVVEEAADLRVGNEGGYAQVIGLVTKDIPDLLDLSEGTHLRPGSPAALVGSVLAEEYGIRAGSRIALGDEEMRVAGVLEERGFAFDINPDYAVVIERDRFREQFPQKEGYDYVVITVADPDEMEGVKAAVETLMNRRDETVDVTDSRESLDQVNEIYDAMGRFLLGIGAVSLVIAAVSILNVMIISVTERRHEIGVMRSIGALRGEVMRMFLYEALVLGLVGSLVGGALSFVGGYVISLAAIEVFTAGTTFAEGATVFDPLSLAYILGAMLFGVVTSVAAGVYPAWQAAQMTPIEALQG